MGIVIVEFVFLPEGQSCDERRHFLYGAYTIGGRPVLFVNVIIDDISVEGDVAADSSLLDRTVHDGIRPCHAQVAVLVFQDQ